MNDLAQLVAAMGALGPLAPHGVRLAGVGWATVDLDRTLAGLAGVRVAHDVGEEPSLGARARVVPAGPVAVVILEPSTEGRLAAFLARRGEGIACLYLAAAAPIAGAGPTALGVPGRLLSHDRPWGPFVMLVEDAVGP